MKLTNDEKEMLLAFLNHPWRELAKRYDAENLAWITKSLMELDIESDDPKVKRNIRENQIAMKSVASYFQSLQSLTNKAYTPWK